MVVLPSRSEILALWDGLANLLLFEHPPGTGFSYCVDASDKPTACEWNDQTQAVAFYNTLTAFYAAWPTYSQHELKIIGESYAGLLIPFLTHEIYKRQKEIPARQLRGIAMGNGCPGTSGATPTNRGTCNGPYGSYDTQHIMELAYGHSALPRDSIRASARRAASRALLPRGRRIATCLATRAKSCSTRRAPPSLVQHLQLLRQLW